MFINQHLIEILDNTLEQHVNSKAETKVVKTVSGGSINNCYQLEYASERFFLKLNSAQAFPNMFLAEAEGLSQIANENKIAVPRVIAKGEAGGEQFLLMKWIDKGPNTKRSQELLGRELADLHRSSNSYFGLNYDNYMGSLPQYNGEYASFSDFFIEKRLMVQVEIGLSKKLITNSLKDKFELLYKRLPNLIPEEKPGLVHGDLWSGNYMIGSKGEPYLIDPAIAYSHREVDLAMTSLFGGFDDSFYQAYNEHFPFQNEWEKRIGLWNLYPLLVHLNLFGLGYLNDIERNLKAWV